MAARSMSEGAAAPLPGVAPYLPCRDVPGALERASAALEDPGDRRYDACNREGHVSSFAQHVRDVDPADRGATPTGS